MDEIVEGHRINCPSSEPWLEVVLPVASHAFVETPKGWIGEPREVAREVPRYQQGGVVGVGGEKKRAEHLVGNAGDNDQMTWIRAARAQELAMLGELSSALEGEDLVGPCNVEPTQRS